MCCSTITKYIANGTTAEVGKLGGEDMGEIRSD